MVLYGCKCFPSTLSRVFSLRTAEYGNMVEESGQRERKHFKCSVEQREAVKHNLFGFASTFSITQSDCVDIKT